MRLGTPLLRARQTFSANRSRARSLERTAFRPDSLGALARVVADVKAHLGAVVLDVAIDGGEAGVVELVCLVGYYVMVCMTLATFEVAPAPGAKLPVFA